MKYRKGCLIEAALSGEVSVIAHGCNCFNSMKTGIAPIIAGTFTEAYDADQRTLSGDHYKLGKYTSADSQGVVVFNLYSQYSDQGRKEGKMDLSYEALNNALRSMALDLEYRCRSANMPTSELTVGLPKIGSGLAGGDWDIIEKLIDHNLGHFDVIIYTLK